MDILTLLESVKADTSRNLGLVLAAEGCQVAAVEHLLARGADANARVQGGTPLVGAALTGCDEVVKLLVGGGADVNAMNEQGALPLVGAALEGREDAVRTLMAAGADVNARDRRGRTALMGAAIRGQADLAQALLDKGADLEARDEEGQAAWTYAAMSRQMDVIEVFRKAREKQR